jgi:outer membrane protein OmpA-like peptidoglycan-associated protein
MKRLWTGALILVFLVVGCAAPMNKTQQGALVGTGVGAATGAILGGAIGGSGQAAALGALGGAAAGALVGGAIGSYMDKQEQELRAQMAYMEAASIQRDQDVLAVTFRSDAFFAVDSATLLPGAYDEMDRVADILNRYPQTTIRVEGHTDSTGSEDYNVDLSRHRAESVAIALQQRGVHPARIQTVGYGESRPIASNDNEGGRQLNRRVTIEIVPVRA